MKPSGNTLVLFEEIGGDPTLLSFATTQVESLCSHISESHPPPVDMWISGTGSRRNSKPVLSLECPSPNQIISSIKFASFGTPHGSCGSFGHGKCSSAKALSVVQKVLHRYRVEKCDYLFICDRLYWFDLTIETSYRLALDHTVVTLEFQ